MYRLHIQIHVVRRLFVLRHDLSHFPLHYRLALLSSLTKLERFADDITSVRIHNHARKFRVRRAFARRLVGDYARALE